jgi:chromosomal replication initiation ATPase DnaA
LTIWDEILTRMRTRMPEEDFRRWFGATAYASDHGNQVTVWVPTEAIRRHIMSHYDEELRSALGALGRTYTTMRFVVGGSGDDEEETD